MSQAFSEPSAQDSEVPHRLLTCGSECVSLGFFFPLCLCDDNMHSIETTLGMLIFPQGNNMWFSALGRCWAVTRSNGSQSAMQSERKRVTPSPVYWTAKQSVQWVRPCSLLSLVQVFLGYNPIVKEQMYLCFRIAMGRRVVAWLGRNLQFLPSH